MKIEQVYPFGSTSRKVEQQDKSPKKVFVLGSYANSVRAKWVDNDGNVRARALPVANEPCVFWRGEKPGEIIKNIKIPPELGKLKVAEDRFNGCSGKYLDKLYLEPLGLTRNDIWLCYLSPYAILDQVEAFEVNEAYNPLIRVHNLPKCTVRNYIFYNLFSRSRIKEVITELDQSQADTVILLGEVPIKNFLSQFSDFSSLSDFGNGLNDYGKKCKVEIAGKLYNVLPLIEPREAKEDKNHFFSRGFYHNHWRNRQLIIRMITKRVGKDPTVVTKKPEICPICGKMKIASYLYKQPPYSEELMEIVKDGSIILKNSPIADDDPKYQCTYCEFEFFEVVE